MFRHAIAGIDGTRAAFEAVRQASGLVSPGGAMTLLAVADRDMAAANHWGPGRLVHPDDGDVGAFGLAVERLEDRARGALEAAASQVPDGIEVESRLVGGWPSEVLRSSVEEDGVDLLALGSHGGRRLAGIALGGNVTELLHEAPCSVLVARPPYDPRAFPSRVLVAVDGSDASLRALDVARGLAERAGATGTALMCRGASMGAEAVRRLAGPLVVRETNDRPVDALIEAAAFADLLVVGARGLGGLRALGSVSERVAHRAECSVLVVRPSTS